MKTIFLAAGKSTRLDPLTDKNLLPFCGKPLVIQLLENAQKGGLGDFIIVVNEENKKSIENLLKKYHLKAQITIQKNLKEGMAGGVLSGLDFVSDDESVFILGGNDYIDPKVYQTMIQDSSPCEGLIVAQKVKEYFPGGYLEIEENGKIKRIIEKPTPGKEPSDLVNMVAHFFKKAQPLKKALKEVSSSFDDRYERALQKLFDVSDFRIVPYEGFWKAIKYPWHILDMAQLFMSLFPDKNHIAKDVYIADTARIRGEKIYIEKGVRIFDNAVIQGPCYIGENTIIGNNALVRDSHIGPECVIGYNSEIVRSYFHSQIQTHIAYVGDSIVDKGVNFGAFSCTANLRLDQKNIKVSIKDQRIDSQRNKLGCIVGQNVQIGTHAMLMPGSKIGKEDFIGPGMVHK